MSASRTTTDETPLSRLWSPLRLINAVSLDAPIVAASWFLLIRLTQPSLEAARWPGVAGTDRVTMLVLSLTVWLIYSGDRLLDCRDLDFGKPTSYQHRFAHRWRRPLSAAWTIVFMMTGSISLLFLDAGVFRFGLGMSASVALYLLAVHTSGPLRRSVPKEFLVGGLFAAGVVGPAAVSGGGPDRAWVALLLFGLFSLNCLLVSVVQVPVDRAQSTPSMMLSLPRLRTRLPWLGWIVTGTSATLMGAGQIDATVGTSIAVSAGATTHLMYRTKDRSDESGVRIAYAADMTLIVVPLLFAYVALRS